MSALTDFRKQVVTGLVPPQMGEAMIRQVYPSVARFPGIASLGRGLLRTYVLAPLGWLVMAGPYFAKVLPFFACRYSLTNRRLMIRRGWTMAVSQEVPLQKINEVRIHEDANSPFFRAANLEIVSDGQVVMRLPGVTGPEAFRQAILNASKAWGPVLAAAAKA